MGEARGGTSPLPLAQCADTVAGSLLRRDCRVAVGTPYITLRKFAQDRGPGVAGETVAPRLDHVGRMNGATSAGAVLSAGVTVIEMQRGGGASEAAVNAARDHLVVVDEVACLACSGAGDQCQGGECVHVLAFLSWPPCGADR